MSTHEISGYVKPIFSALNLEIMLSKLEMARLCLRVRSILWSKTQRCPSHWIAQFICPSMRQHVPEYNLKLNLPRNKQITEILRALAVYRIFLFSLRLPIWHLKILTVLRGERLY